VLGGLSPDELYEVLAQPCRDVPSDDWLVGVIAGRVAVDAEFVRLFEFVRFERLSAEGMEAFIESVGENGIAGAGWDAVARCLAMPFEGQVEAAPAEGSGPHCEVDPSNPLNGMLAHLTQVHGGNVHTKGVVTITSSSIASGRPMGVADRGSGPWFGTAHAPNQWICFDFGARRVRPTAYTIKSFGGHGWYPKSWVIETSSDGEDWREIDRRDDDASLNGPSRTSTFSIASAGAS